mmetsp:Transcript_27987/g.24735  ORF Transcript_27987/g.24735 Transcript_27987/m.24735 type:complete len:211 (+) Transcript_27987:6-638(+)
MEGLAESKPEILQKKDAESIGNNEAGSSSTGSELVTGGIKSELYNNPCSNDLQQMAYYLSLPWIQHSLTSQLMSIQKYCSCSNDLTQIMASLANSYGYYGYIPNMGVFSNNISNTPFGISTLGAINENGGVDISQLSKMAFNSDDNEFFAHNTQGSGSKSVSKPKGNSRNTDSGDDDDEDIMRNHPFEIKYILNKKTNRRLKRMVCKFDN